MQASVPAIVWDARLATGLADIDAQHGNLFSEIEEVRRLSAAESSLEALRAVINRFRNSTVFHFDYEESVMDEHAVDARHATLHKKAHSDFIEHIDRVISLLESGLDAPTMPFVEFMSKWMSLHVSSADATMSRHVMAARTGQPPPVDAHASEAETLEDFYAKLGDRTIEILELNLQLQREIATRKQAQKDFELSRLWIRAVADLSTSWEYWLGPQGEVLYMSPACEDISGYTVKEFERTPALLDSIIHPEDRHLMDIRKYYLSRGEEDLGELDMRIVRKDGEIRWVAHSCRAIHDNKGKHYGRRVSRRDRTQRYKDEEYLRMAATVIETANEAVLVASRNLNVVSLNAAFTRLTGFGSDELVGNPLRTLIEAANRTEHLRDIWAALVREGAWRGELTARRKDGTTFICAMSANCVRNDAGRVTQFVSVFSDVTEKREAEERIRYLAHYDVLTGLPNRALFNERLRQTVFTAKRYQSNFGLMFIDLNKFKPVNDRFGHDVGDMLLREIGARLEDSVRQSDTAARIGGDEFVILLPGANHESRLRAVAQKVLEELERPFEYNGHDIQISASIGFVLYPQHGDDFDSILRHADRAMYQAKHGKHAQIVSYSELPRGDEV